MKDIQRRVGLRIRDLREKKGLSQEALASVCNLHRTYIGLIERGERNLSLTTVEQIAEGLGVSVSVIFQHVDQGDAKARKRTRPRKATLKDVAADVATIRQILIEAKLAEAQRFR